MDPKRWLYYLDALRGWLGTDLVNLQKKKVLFHQIWKGKARGFIIGMDQGNF